MYHSLTYRHFKLPSLDTSCKPQVTACELRLGRILPDAVREWFMRADARSLPGLDHLLPVDKITETDGSLIFMRHQFGKFLSEYRADLAKEEENPWVDGQIDSRGWYPIAKFTDFIFLQIWHSQPAEFCFWGSANNLQIEKLQVLFPSDLPITTDPIEWPLTGCMFMALLNRANVTFESPWMVKRAQG